LSRLATAVALICAATLAHGQAPDLGSDAQRATGKKVYDKFCSQCHGDTGAGDGIAAVHLDPLPRNFTTGKFKVRTTPSGAMPTTTDLKNIIRRGMPYTSMPAWPDLSDDELTGLAYHIKSFSPDFANADFNKAPVELPSAPAYSKDSAERGRKVYEETGCIACHGNLGRGDGASGPTLVDDLGHPIRPADFTQRWTFRAGPTREDIFRTMTTGLNGTPMPAFGDALSPEDRWAITDYMYSLGEGDEPRYATLIHAHHLDEPFDPAKGASAFDGAKVSRLPIFGQITEPGRQFHPPIVSIEVQAVYDQESIAFLLRWNDMAAEKSGSNSPAIPVTIEDEAKGPATPAAGATPQTDEWGQPIETPQASPAEADPWGEAPAAPSGAPAAGASQFSDAIALQLPMTMPQGAVKPYFIFGDAANPVDLWFVDLAKGAATQWVGKGSASVEMAEVADVTATATYQDGQWSVILKRALRPDGGGVTFTPGEFVPIAFSVWDGFSRDRGNKRGLTSWFTLHVEPEHIPSPAGPMMRAGLAVFALEILIVVLVRRKKMKA
jgi:cytochrome c oxidase cbb3-type subunit 2